MLNLLRLCSLAKIWLTVVDCESLPINSETTFRGVFLSPSSYITPTKCCKKCFDDFFMKCRILISCIILSTMTLFDRSQGWFIATGIEFPESPPHLQIRALAFCSMEFLEADQLNHCNVLEKNKRNLQYCRLYSVC